MVAYNDRIVMVDPADGKPLELLDSECQPRPPDSEGNLRIWQFIPGNGKQFYSLPLVLDGETLLAVAYDQYLFEIDRTGARGSVSAGIQVQGLSGHTVADMTASDDLIYMGLSASNLVALDRQTYDLVWTAKTDHGVWSKPLLANGVLYFSSLDHHLYAVDAETGERLWRLDLQGTVTSSPLLYKDKLYIGSFGRKFFEISLDGEILNEYVAEDWIWGTLAIVDGILYGADLAGNVYALDTTENLRQVWKQKVANRAIRPTPLVLENTIIVASRDQRVYWLNRADGTLKVDSEGNPLVRELQAEILSDVLLVEPGGGADVPEPYIIVSTINPGQLLAAYALDNGQVIWSYSFQ
jgi:outer membrane protein assembly factor BamB